MIHTIVSNSRLFFTVLYAVMSCGLIIINIINIKQEHSWNISMYQALISLALVVILAGCEYDYVYKYIAVLSCLASTVIAILGA